METAGTGPAPPRPRRRRQMVKHGARLSSLTFRLGARLTLPVALAGTFAMAACSLAPEYKVPPSPVAAQYKTIGPWITAQPADQLPRDEWWKIYNEPKLDALEER